MGNRSQEDGDPALRTALRSFAEDEENYTVFTTRKVRGDGAAVNPGVSIKVESEDRRSSEETRGNLQVGR